MERFMQIVGLAVVGLLLWHGGLAFAASTPPEPATGSSIQPNVGVYPQAYQPGEKFKDCDDCPEMVVVPEGQYMMGSPSDEQYRYEDEGSMHRVEVPSFALGKYEVTRGQFATFVSETGYSAGGNCYVDKGGGDRGFVLSKYWRDPNFTQTDRHPVVCVIWDDAKAYVEWLGRKTGKGYRLPSESEWEYAARAGKTAARYWGNDPADACGFANVHDRTSKSVNKFIWTHHECTDGHAQTAPVGSFRHNGFGLHDVLGNVWEWVEDCWHDSYSYYGTPIDGSAWTKGECEERVLRGGSWDDGLGHVRSANRNKEETDYRNYVIGFRVARTLP